MSKDITTTVDLVIRIEVVGDPIDVANCRHALECLAEVMAVQAEDGLWSLGHENAEVDGIQSEPVANIMRAKVHAVLIGEATQDSLRARYERVKAIADELATIASHAVHVPGKTTAMDERIAGLVHEAEALETQELQPVDADDLITAARALSDTDLGHLRRAVNALAREGTVDELTTRAVALSDIQLGLLRQFVNGEFENRIRFTKGLTEDEQQLLAKSKIDCVKAVRERTGLGLVDSKELVDRWQRGER